MISSRPVRAPRVVVPIVAFGVAIGGASCAVAGSTVSGAISPGHATAITPSATPSTYHTYRDAERGYTIAYPLDWIVSDDQHQGEVVFTSADSDAAFDLGVVDAAPSQTLDTFATNTLTGLGDRIPNFQLLSSDVLVVSGHAARRLQYVGEHEGVQVEWLQALLLANGRAYILTFATKADRFERWHPLAEWMLESLRIEES